MILRSFAARWCDAHHVLWCRLSPSLMSVLCLFQTSNQLRAFVFSMRSLHIWFWVESRIHWNRNQSEEQHGFRSKRRIEEFEEHLLTFNVILDKNRGDGIAIVDHQPLIFQKPSTGSIGNYSGKRWEIMAYQNTWFRTINNVEQLLDQRKKKLRLWHCSWRAAKVCSQPTFASFDPWLGTVQVAGTTSWCWLQCTGWRGCETGFALCW